MPLAIYPWQEALSRDLEIFRHRMPSGIIVSGPRDIGTFELVLAFTKSLMCENPAEDGTPCGKCPGCRLAEAGTHPDIRFLLSEEEAARHDLPIPESAGKKLSDEISIAAVRELRLRGAEASPEPETRHSHFAGGPYPAGRRVSSSQDGGGAAA